MRGDSDALQRRLDAGARRPRGWCPARGDILAVLSAESVEYRAAELKMLEIERKREAGILVPVRSMPQLLPQDV